MTRVTPIAEHPDPVSADETAAAWMLRRAEAGETFDNDAFQRWLTEDDANPRAWARVRGSWAAFDQAEGDALLDAMRRHALMARPVRFPTRPWVPAALAAAIVVAVLAGGVLTFERFAIPSTDHNRPAELAVAGSATSDYATAVGQQRLVALPDGSHVTLDTNSAIRVAFAGGKRALSLLRGRAFFDVAHDAAHPFTVAAAGRLVTDVGTQFDVRLDRDRFEVVILQGRVLVRGAGPAPAALALHAGQQLIAEAGSPARIEPAQLGDAQDWRLGLVEFRDEPLSAAAAELNRYSRDQLVVSDPGVANLRLTGTFHTGDPSRFGRTLAEVYPIRLVRTGPDRLEIEPNN
jgi:transmembrane sensor